jgi:hypothetical protein
MAPPPPTPVDTTFTSANSSFVDLVTPSPTGSSEKENVPPLVDVGDGSAVGWDKVDWSWERKGKRNVKGNEEGKETAAVPGSDKTGPGGSQTEGGDVAKDETESDEEEELPHVITYEALVDFSRNDEQRATLSEELKSRGCGTLLDLLRLWWGACQLERGAANTRLWTQYSQATALRLRDNIRGLEPLAFAPGKPLPIVLLNNFAHQATALAHLSNRSSAAILDITKTADEQRRRIFALLEHYDITYHGNWTFVNTGYLAPSRYGLADESYGTIDWKKAPATQLNTTFYDPQAET